MYKLNNTIHINISDVKYLSWGKFLPCLCLYIRILHTKKPFMKLTTCVKWDVIY